MSGTSDGASLRKQIKKMEVIWIWGCKDCGRVKAGCAYTLKYAISS
ncbi:putative zinc-binding ribosomal protein [Lupinus albus]|uniref:Putative zinc-binding ribosomal protein n=1 Tax=Lupinus albus TaxID=3870 RepID=A0A6A4P2B1_LUPAL|nr:putative zinc-binding ribosomal protein [Lupinus albus]